MKSISLYQPWASLLVTRRVCAGCQTTTDPHKVFGEAGPPMVKRFETRSWPAPKSIIGTRVAFHATKKRPEHMAMVGDFMVNCKGDGSTVMYDEATCRRLGRDVHVDLPLGAIVGSGVIARSLPIQRCSDHEAHICATVNGLLLHEPLTFIGSRIGETEEDITDQFLYGDWSSGRWAWEITDAAPTAERCPQCRGRGAVNILPTRDMSIEALQSGALIEGDRCPACNGEGKCEPIPAVGRQGFWNWDGGA